MVVESERLSCGAWEGTSGRLRQHRTRANSFVRLNCFCAHSHSHSQSLIVTHSQSLTVTHSHSLTHFACRAFVVRRLSSSFVVVCRRSSSFVVVRCCSSSFVVVRCRLSFVVLRRRSSLFVVVRRRSSSLIIAVRRCSSLFFLSVRLSVCVEQLLHLSRSQLGGGSARWGALCRSQVFCLRRLRCARV